MSRVRETGRRRPAQDGQVSRAGGGSTCRAQAAGDKETDR
jgi:hypothetical protein